MSEGSLKARTFLESIAGYTDAPEAAPLSQDRPNRLATVDAAYTGTGNPMVLFDGESLMGIRTYTWVGRRPLASERVVMVPVGNTYVIIGAAGDGGVTPYRAAAGTVNPSTTAFTTYNFPVGRFTVAPLVVATITSGAGASAGATIRITTKLAASFQMATSVASIVDWYAVQMTPTSAAG